MFHTRTLVKTDHEGFVLPAGLKLKPDCAPYSSHLCGTAGNIGNSHFFMAMATLDLSDVFNAVDINKVVKVLEEKILAAMICARH